MALTRGSIRVWWGGKQLEAKQRNAAANALTRAAEFVLEEANRTVPFDEGTLKNTGQADVDRANLEASVSYDTPYAVRLHEHPEYNFQGGRRGKWLELTLQEQQDALNRFLIEEMQKVFR